MFIRSIHEDDWPAILKIQSAVYPDIEPESEAVLRSKTTLSHDTCVVISNSVGEILGYCLAHPWSDSPAHLHTIYTQYQRATHLYIHDLAIAPEYKGKQLGKTIYQFMCTKARQMNLQAIGLVSLQQALPFWSRLNFRMTAMELCNVEYGDGAKFMQQEL